MVSNDAVHSSARRVARGRQPREVRPDQYRFVERRDGFRIEHPLRHTVEVRLERWHFRIQACGRTQRCPILASPSHLSSQLASALLGWRERAPQRSSAVRRESWMIARAMKRARRTLLERHRPAVGLVEERLVGLFGELPRLARTLAFYRARYVAYDVATHHAAAIAAGFVDSELWPLAPPSGARIPTYALLRVMRDWRRLFAPGGRTYGSLDRTLMSLPPQIPARVVCALRHVRLERTITNRLELHLLLLCVERSVQRWGELPTCLHVLQHASELAIRRALVRIGEAIHRKLDPRQDDDLRVAANYLNDAKPSGATLSACVEDAIRWHDPHRDLLDLLRRFRLDAPCQHPPDTPTARPPDPLPSVAGLVFLATVGDVIAEGQRMQHCIASYADDAVRGRCFLFHAEHEGETASFEVSADGDLRQAVGPHNGTNGAVLWGAAKLARWVASWARRPA